MSSSLDLVDAQGYLRLRQNALTYKFCRHCSLKLIGKSNKLHTHYKSHPGEEPQFLKFGQEPFTQIYSNFDKFLVNPSIQLLLSEEG